MPDQRQRWQRFLPLQPTPSEPAMRPRRVAETRTYRVGTFCHREDSLGRPFRKPRISTYTSVFSAAWDGCVVFEVEAASADEAKRIAVARRREVEEQKGTSKCE